MYRYRLYNLIIEADLEIPQLLPDKEEYDQSVKHIYVKSETLPDYLEKFDDVGSNITTTESWLCNDVCKLYVHGGDTIGYYLKPEQPVMRLRNFILGFGMSMISVQNGLIAFHCSAIADDDGVLLIAGESGAGKSTTSEVFLRNGYHLLADDMAFISIEDGVAYAAPAFPYTKLCRNVAIERGYDLNELIYVNEQKDKFLVPWKGEYSYLPRKIKGLIYINFSADDDVHETQIQGLDKFHICVNNLFLRHLLRNDKYQPQFSSKCLGLANAIPITVLSRPQGIDTTEAFTKLAIEAVNKF